MRRYFMKRWQWVLLIVELALFAIILILPQVDLPDFTFHGGTAPTAMKARISPVPARIAIVIAPSMSVLEQDVRLRTDTMVSSAPSTAYSCLLLFCVLICDLELSRALPAWNGW